MSTEDEVTPLARQHAGRALRRLAELAEGSGDPDVKDDARQHLEMYLVRLKAIIDNPKTPPELRQAALEKQFLNS